MTKNSRGTTKWLKPSYLGSVLAVLKTRHFISFTLFGICTLFYYFGELVDFAGWKALHLEFWYTVHDIHRLLFLVPIVYTAYSFGIIGNIVVTIASLMVWVPRAIFVSTFPDAIPRTVLFAAFVGAVGSLIAIIEKKYQYLRRVDVPVGNQSNSHQEKENRTESGVFTAGDLEVDLSRRLVKRRRQILKLTPTEYELLSYLIRNSGRVVSHKDILHNVWGTEYNGQNEYLRTFVRQLRRKIEDDPSHPQFIVTEQSVGYRFVIPLEHPQ